MTGNWIDELKQSTDKERKEREEINRQRSKEFFDKMRVKANAERDEMNGLMKQVNQN